MTNEFSLTGLTEKCDIYFEDSLISKELIIKRYAGFLSFLLSSNERSVSLALHTGSICFDVISLLIAAFVCLALDETDTGAIVDSLNEGDMVLYGKTKRERYVWCGFAEKNCIPTPATSKKRYYGVLKQPTRDTKDKIYVPKQYWYLITPYDGDSQLTDGRGIKAGNSNRNNFISYFFGVGEADIPSVTGVSSVIVANKGIFERISKGLRIVYGKGKSVSLLDVVTASYFSDSGEEYQFGSNPSRNEPVLKITGKISTARDLILEKNGNKTVGLVVIGDNAVAKGDSDLNDLLRRKTLKFTHIAMGIDSEFAENFLDTQEDVAVFACTKEYLLRNSLPLQEVNELTMELGKQIDNIVDNSISTTIVDMDCSWEDYRLARESLYSIKQSELNDGEKNGFLITAHFLLNLFITAVFPIERLEKAIISGRQQTGVVSPASRIQELKNLTDHTAGAVKKQCEFVVMFLEYLYQSLLTKCPKYDSLIRRLESSTTGKKVVVVVPKAFYIDIVEENNVFKENNVKVVSINSFDNTDTYDEVIVVGDITGKRFDPLKCRASSNITVLLYECEMHLFKHKMRKSINFEKKLNVRLGVFDDSFDDTDLQIGYDEEPIGKFMTGAEDLERYIDKISAFDVGKFAARISGNCGDAQTAEVGAVGKFVNGEQILFSKFYCAVVIDSAKGIVNEIEVGDLKVGDRLIIFKRDDYTRNTVDYIFENLQNSTRLSDDVMEAAKKATYWKEVLRKYKLNHGLSYRDIARMLQNLGGVIQEVTVRQWLIEESHIIGPRNEDTLLRIAQLTRDPHLLADTHDYYEACRIVRRQRKKILELIGKAIVDKLNGNKPTAGSVLEIIYDNVENLSEILELDGISMLDEPITVPVNLINKPIADLEAIF